MERNNAVSCLSSDRLIDGPTVIGRCHNYCLNLGDDTVNFNVASIVRLVIIILCGLPLST